MSNGRRRVLILGATGEIGSRVARGCVDAGHSVTGVSRGTNTLHRVSLDGVELMTGNMDDADFLKRLAGEREFDVVVHTFYPKTEHVKLAFEHFKGRIAHYFICSSTGTFVPLRYLPADEKHPWREKTYCNSYDQSQRDVYALDLWEEHGFPVAIFRPTNIIGRGRVPLDLWGGRNIRYWQHLRAGEPVEIPGSGNALLQSGCNDDLADAFVKAVPKGREITGEIFIISSKKAITLDRYLAVARDALKSNSRAVPVGGRDPAEASTEDHGSGPRVPGRAHVF